MITLRIGVFFEGTGNNAENSALGLACGAQQPLKPDAMPAVCKPYMVDPDSSYGSDFTNIRKLCALYPESNGPEHQSKSTLVLRRLYIEGIGTCAAEQDNLLGLGTGRGNTGVRSRVRQAFKHIELLINQVIQDNPGSEITALRFDTFGFSRGAAAARHFANEIARASDGPLQQIFDNQKNSFSQGFRGQYKSDIQVGFIGLFDTVASVAGLANLGNLQSAIAPGLQLYLPRSLFSNVVHLVARDEYRANFALNQVKPDHLEIPLPGAHADIGGGYLSEAQERVLLSPMQGLTVTLGTDVTTTSIYTDALRQREQMIAQGWPAPMLEIVTPEPKLLNADAQDRLAPREQRVYAGLQLKRPVLGTLSRVYLRVMHALARQQDVPFEDIPATADYQLPEELQALGERFVAGDYQVSPSEEEMLKLRYIHTSAHWNHPFDSSGQREADVLYVHAPAPGAVRVQHPHTP